MNVSRKHLDKDSTTIDEIRRENLEKSDKVDCCVKAWCMLGSGMTIHSRFVRVVAPNRQAGAAFQCNVMGSIFADA